MPMKKIRVVAIVDVKDFHLLDKFCEIESMEPIRSSSNDVRSIPKGPKSAKRAFEEQIRSKPGMLAKIARGLKIKPQAVSQWKAVPHPRIFEVERITGISRSLLRPDLY